MDGSKNWFRTGFKILIACLIVGWLLSFFDYQALDLVRSLSRMIHSVSEWLLGIFKWALPLILLGAIVVMPVVLVRYGIRMLRKRKN